MLKQDELKDAAARSIPNVTDAHKDDDASEPLATRLSAMAIHAPLPAKATAAAAATTGVVGEESVHDDFDMNDMDDPLAGFEAQRSGIKDLSLK
ncbi:hypothetical protein BGZ99_000921, partial [Dissophora globulifera]